MRPSRRPHRPVQPSQLGPMFLSQLQVLQLVGVGYSGQANALLAQGFGASMVLDHLLGQETDPGGKLAVAMALIDGVLPLPVVAWHLEAHGVHPASLAFAQKPSCVRDYLQRMTLWGSFSNWKIFGYQKNWYGPMKLEVDPSLGIFPEGLVLPAWKLDVCRNPFMRDLRLKVMSRTLWVEGCPNLRSIGLDEPAGPVSGELDECPFVCLRQCPSLESLSWLGPLRELCINECGGAYIQAEPLVTRSLVIRNCSHLEALPEIASVQYQMVLHELPKLRSMPRTLRVDGGLWVISCPSLENLPEELEVLGDLILDDLPSLRDLPKSLKVGGTIYVQGCPRPSAKTN